MNTLLIAGAFWLLVIPPLHYLDGVPAVKMGSPYSEWKIADFFENSAACRRYRTQRHAQYWQAWKTMYGQDRRKASLHFSVANQFNNGHCMPFQIWQQRKMEKSAHTY